MRALGRLSQEQIVFGLAVLLCLGFAVALPGFLTTNNLLGGNTLIRVGVARDPQQAPPIAGTWFGPRDAYLGMDVQIRVTRQRGAA